MSTTLSLVSELERIARALDRDGASTGQPSLPRIAAKIAKTIGVRDEEVAILGVSTRWKHLHFLVPEALKQVPHEIHLTTAAGTKRSMFLNLAGETKAGFELTATVAMPVPDEPAAPPVSQTPVMAEST